MGDASKSGRATPVIPAITAPDTPQIPSCVQVYTHNITRRPIAWDPARQRPTQEVVHAIHSALHFGLDPCVNHPHEQPSFCVVDATKLKADSEPGSNTATEVNSADPLIESTSIDGSEKNPRDASYTLFIPSIEDLALSISKSISSSSRLIQTSQLTVKLFAGFHGAPLTASLVRESLEALKRLIGNRKQTIDRFVVSLEGVKWGGERSINSRGVFYESSGGLKEDPESKICTEEEGEGMQHINAMVEGWQYLSSQPDIDQLGVADFSEAHLARLSKLIDSRLLSLQSNFKAVVEATSTSLPSTGGTAAGVLKHPTIDQLNFDDDLPPPITEYSKEHGISLVTHSDDLGSPSQMLNIIREFKTTLPLPQPLKAAELDPHTIDNCFRISWILKYTILLPDRGLVADNGYILAANFPAGISTSGTP